MNWSKKVSAFLACLLFLCCCVVSAPAAGKTVTLGVNVLDGTPGEGQSLVLTRKSGLNIATGASDFSWWKTATFEYDDQAGTYVVVSLDLVVNGTTGKNNDIPEDGFVLCVNIGNDYSASGGTNFINKLATDTYNALDSLSIGDTAYVYGMDLATGSIDRSSSAYYNTTFTSEAKIVVTDTPADGYYQPERTNARLESVTMTAGNTGFEVGKELVVSWDAVPNAESYRLNVFNSTVVNSGASVAAGVKVNDTSYTFSAEAFSVGNDYTFVVTALGGDYRESFATRYTVLAISHRATEELFKEKTIVAFGDSITFLPGWVKILSGDLGTQIINSGVSGDRTTEAIQRFATDVAAKKPDIVIILFGMNDQAVYLSSGKPIVSVEAYERNYRRIIESCKQLGARVVLLTCHSVRTASGYYIPGGYGLDYGTGNLDSYNEVIRKLAEEYQTTLVDIAKLSSTEKDGFAASGDGIHLSTYGGQKYAEWIADAFYENLSEDESSAESTESVTEESSEAESSETSTASLTESSTEADSSSPEGGSNGEKWVLIGVCAAVLALLIFFAIPKKKKQ